MPTETAPTILTQHLLHSTEGGSDKEYRVTVSEDGGGYSVQAESRRRGDGWNDQGFKLQGGTLESATKKATATIKRKTAKGYKVISIFDRASGETTAVAPVAPGAPAGEDTDTGYRPQLLNIIEESEAEAKLSDDRYVMQQKHDGRRHAVRQDSASTLLGINKLGRAVPVDSKVEAALATLFKHTGGYHVDGEKVGTYFLFDLLQDGPTEAAGDIRKKGYIHRMNRLEQIAAEHPEAFKDGSIRVTETWIGTEAKTKAYAALKAAKAEGVVFKLRNAPYTAGRPNSGGDHLKFKFYAEASFIVKKVNTQRSVELGLITPEGIVQGMGNCTIPANQSIPEAGSIIEVRYLYAFPNGGKVYQPTFKELRNDILAGECLTTQLKFKAGTEDDD